MDHDVSSCIPCLTPDAFPSISAPELIPGSFRTIECKSWSISLATIPKQQATQVHTLPVQVVERMVLPLKLQLVIVPVTTLPLHSKE